jgi:cell division protein FtsB
MPKRWVVIPLIAVLVMLFFTVFGERGLLHIHHLRQEQDELTKRLADMQRENERLKREIEALRTDRLYLENLARREFGLVKPNEVVYRFMTSQHAAAVLPASGAPPVKAPAAKAAPRN